MGVGTDVHKKNLSQYMSTLSFFEKPKQVKSGESGESSVNATDILEVDLTTVPEHNNNNKNTTPDPIPSIFSIQSCAKAEIIWALNCVQQGFSDNSVKDFGDTLRGICPTSSEAQTFKMASTKLMYVVNHGLYPYFKKLLDTDIGASPYTTSMFDESMNDVLQKSEMDVHIRYWDDSAKRAMVRFYDSRFLGHTTHQDLENFNDSLKDVDTSKMLQVSMDRPNTNLLFLDCLQKERKDDGLSELIDIGSCNLHTVHGCLEAGVKASGWDLKKLLKGCHRLLHDTAARRDDYYRLTGSPKFPFPFIVTRWVEDRKVADRLILVWPNMLKIYEFWEGLAKSKCPKSKSYINVLVHISDKLIVSQLHFFVYMAGFLEPYLTCHQGEGPMIPFMDGDIQKLYRGVLAVIVKPKVLDNCKNGLDLMKLDLKNDEILIKSKKIHLGFAAEDAILKLSGDGDAEGEQVNTMREGAKKFVLAMCHKLAARNPLSYVIVRNDICFNPKSILALGEDILCVKIKKLIMKLVHLNKIASNIADSALKQYREFLSDHVVLHKEKLLAYDRKTKRLDDFFFDDLKVEDNYPDLAVVMEIINTLSHGQASVEHGFNDNNVVLKDNQKGNTIVARRFIKDYMAKNKYLPHTVPITQALVKSYRKARKQYQQYLDEEKAKRDKDEKSEELHKVENEMKVLGDEADNLESTIEEMSTEYFKLMFKAEKQSNILLVVQGNALK